MSATRYGSSLSISSFFAVGEPYRVPTLLPSHLTYGSAEGPERSVGTEGRDVGGAGFSVPFISGPHHPTPTAHGWWTDRREVKRPCERRAASLDNRISVNERRITWAKRLVSPVSRLAHFIRHSVTRPKGVERNGADDSLWVSIIPVGEKGVRKERHYPRVVSLSLRTLLPLRRRLRSEGTNRGDDKERGRRGGDWRQKRRYRQGEWEADKGSLETRVVNHRLVPSGNHLIF